MDSGYSRRVFIGGGLGALAATQAIGKPNENAGDPSDRARISRADLIYDRPVERSEAGMPLGNGRMGTLVWTTPAQVCFQINRVDVYANNSYSNSFFERHDDYCSGCAFVDIDFAGFGEPPFAGPGFHQRLAVYDGAMALRGRGVETEMVAWPEQDVMAIEVKPSKPTAIQVKLRMLRHADQYFGKELRTFERDHIAAVRHRSQTALCQLLIRGSRIVLTQEFREGGFCNRSAVAIGIAGRESQPDIANETEIRLTTDATGRPFTLLIASAASFDPKIDVAAAALANLEAAEAKGYRSVAKDTADWWHDFWSRGRVELHSADGTADTVEENYNYFLYLMGASSGGKYPPKFNGMLWNTGGDLRAWGAQHWFANLSCYYEGLFEANRPGLLDPAFDMYSGMYGACCTAARQQWGSQGMYIPETTYFDGLEKLPEEIAEEMRKLYLMRKPWRERSQQFQTYSETKHPHSSRWNWMKSGRYEKGRWVITERGYGPYGNVTHIFGSTAKIAYLYWRRYEFTQDREWLRTRAYPMLRGAAEFYCNHPNMSKESDGKYHLRYANSNESVWGARDTDEDLSSMRGVFPALLRASEILGVDAEMRPVWKEFLANLAPFATSSDPDALVPADYRGPEVFVRGRKPAVKAGRGILPDQNSLPVWFFDLCNLESHDTEMLRLANTTFNAYFRHAITAETTVGVLSKLPIAASILGRSDAVRDLVPAQIRGTPERVTRNGGVLRNRMSLREGPQALAAERLGRAAQALHLALLQSAPAEPAGEPVIRLFPAWPKDWDACFTLRARGGFLVSSAMQNGKVKAVELVSHTGVSCRLHNPWGAAEVELRRNGAEAEMLSGALLSFPTAKQERIVLKPRSG